MSYGDDPRQAFIRRDFKPAFEPHPWLWADRAPYYVYRCFRQDGSSLYVGITARHPYERLSEHVADGRWAGLVAYLDWAEMPNEATARHYECAEIRRLNPPYNSNGGKCACQEHSLLSNREAA